MMINYKFQMLRSFLDLGLSVLASKTKYKQLLTKVQIQKANKWYSIVQKH